MSTCHSCGVRVDPTRPITVRVFVKTRDGERELCRPCWAGEVQPRSVRK